MSADDPVTKNEIRFIQNDILDDVKKLESNVNNKFFKVNQVFSNKEIEYTSKLDKFSDNVKELLSVIVRRKLDNDKIEELLNMKTKIDEQLIENKTKIIMLARNLENATFKYDRIVLDNLQVPGIIGVACKYRNCKSFFQNINKEIDSIQQFKDQQNKNSKEYKDKMDAMIKKVEILSSDLNEKCKTIYNTKFTEFQNLMEIRHKEMEHQMQIKIIEKTNELQKYFDFENVKFQLYKNFNGEMEKFSKILDDNTKNLKKQNEDYNKLNKKLDHLMDLIKNEKIDLNDEFKRKDTSSHTIKSKKSIVESLFKKNSGNKNETKNSSSNNNKSNISNESNKSSKSNKTIKTTVVKNEKKNRKSVEFSFVTSRTERNELNEVSPKKQKLLTNNFQIKDKLLTNNIKPIKRVSSSEILKAAEKNDSRVIIVNSNNNSKLVKKREVSKKKDNLDIIDTLLTNRENNDKDIKNECTTINNVNNLKENLDISKSEKMSKENIFIRDALLRRDSSSFSEEKETPNNNHNEKEIKNFDDPGKNNEYIIKREQSTNKLKLCSVDLMANEKITITKIKENPLNLKNCLNNDINNSNKKTDLLNFHKNENIEKINSRNVTATKKKSSLKIVPKDLYDNGMSSTLQVGNIHKKFFNKTYNNFPKTPNSINKNNEREKLSIDCNNTTRNNMSRPIINIKAFTYKEPISQNKSTAPSIKFKEIENSKNNLINFFIPNDKKNVQKGQMDKIVAQINEKINSIKNSNEAVNIRIKSLEEKYKPLNNQINEILLMMNQISEYIKQSEINNVQSKTINANKIISQDSSYTNINIKNTYIKNKNNIKLNNSEPGIFLNFSRNKIKKDKEKETIKISTESKIKDKKQPQDGNNVVLRKVEPFLIKIFKNENK